MPEIASDGDVGISDDELTELAMAADPDAILPSDAVPIAEVLGTSHSSLLPDWYMPAAAGVPSYGRRWKRTVAIVIIVAFVAINAAGLCSTYGRVGIG